MAGRPGPLLVAVGRDDLLVRTVELAPQRDLVGHGKIRTLTQQVTKRGDAQAKYDLLPISLRPTENGAQSVREKNTRTMIGEDKDSALPVSRSEAVNIILRYGREERRHE